MEINSANKVAILTFLSCFLSLLALIAGLLFMADAQNRQSLVSERKLIESGMAAQGQTLSKLSRDYSWWTDFYNALTDKNLDWVVANAAGIVYATQSVDMAVMFDGNTDPVFAWDTATGEKSDLSIVDENLAQLVKTHAGKSSNLELDSKFHYMTLKGKPALVAYARVVATEAESLKQNDPKPAFAIAYYLTPERMANIGKAFYIGDLNLGPGQSENTVTLTDNAGVLVGNLTWAPAHPGTDTLFKLVLPLSLIALVLFAASVHLTAQARKQAHTLLANERKARSDADTAHLEALGSAKMAELGKLTATVAHEIRNPLGAVRTSAFVLRRKLGDNLPGFVTLMDRIENGVMRCDDIIAQLLDYSRSREITKRNVNFDDWVAAIASDQAKNLPKEIELECNLSLGDQEVPIDSERLQRVLVNLLSNASEAISSKNESRSSGERIVVSTRSVGNRVEVTVSDTGPGISDDVKNKIFQPLFTTKNFGTGLGLAASVNILQMHGGSLAFDNGENGGTVFKFNLPSEGTAQAA